MAYSNIKMSDIAVVSSTLHDLSGVVNDLSGVVNDLSGVVNDLSGVVNDLSVTPVSDPLPEFTLTADVNLNSENGSSTFQFEDTTKGNGATTAYSQGITHTNQANVFTVSEAGQYLISYFLREDNTTPSNSNARLYGYSCIIRLQANGVEIYEYSNPAEYVRNLGSGTMPADDAVLSATISVTFNAGEKFKIRYNRLYAQNSDVVNVRKSKSRLRIERIKYIVT